MEMNIFADMVRGLLDPPLILDALLAVPPPVFTSVRPRRPWIGLRDDAADQNGPPCLSSRVLY